MLENKKKKPEPSSNNQFIPPVATCRQIQIAFWSEEELKCKTFEP